MTNSNQRDERVLYQGVSYCETDTSSRQGKLSADVTNTQFKCAPCENSKRLNDGLATPNRTYLIDHSTLNHNSFAHQNGHRAFPCHGFNLNTNRNVTGIKTP